jgi:hypothetical protein
MSKKYRLISACSGLLAVALAFLLTGPLSAGEDDTKAEKAIKALGGEVIRNRDASGRPIITVDFIGTKVTDVGLKELAGLKSLHYLYLNGTRVTDAGLKELVGFKTLRTLTLWTTQVTDAGLKELAGLTNLQYLELGRTQVTDAGVAELRKALPKCEIIR